MVPEDDRILALGLFLGFSLALAVMGFIGTPGLFTGVVLVAVTCFVVGIIEA